MRKAPLFNTAWGGRGWGGVGWGVISKQLPVDFDLGYTVTSMTGRIPEIRKGMEFKDSNYFSGKLTHTQSTQENLSPSQNR